MPSVRPGLFSPPSPRPGASAPHGELGRDGEKYDPRGVLLGVTLAVGGGLLAWAALAFAFWRLS